MRIAVPRERKQGEKRVAITPAGVRILSDNGHQVFIEKAAGQGSGFSDQEYLAAGADILETLEETWSRAELLVKVKEPDDQEIPFFRPDLSIFCFLHPAAFSSLTRSLVERGVCALDYDLLQLEDGRLPILEPMSIVAGKLAVQCGAFALQTNGGGPGILLGGAGSSGAAKTVVIGGGIAGSNAASIALGMGSETVVLDINPETLERLQREYPGLRTVFSTEENIKAEIKDAHLVIGSVLIPGDLAPKLITREMLSSMRQGSVIVDVCIDQGGFSETSKATSIADPTYEVDGVIHYCVANMPALAARTATEALTEVTFPYLESLANHGIKEALSNSKPLLSSLTSLGGKLCNETVGKAIGLEAVKASDLSSWVEETLAP